MSVARRPIASIKQLIDTWRAGAGTYTDGDVVTLGQHAHVTRADVGTSIVMGGATNYENVIGGNLDNVNTATSNLAGAPTLADEDGNWNTILGGYDNVVNGWANTVGGFHQKVGLGANHTTILGGSLCSVADEAAYATILGGNANTVGADGGTIAGGISNAVGAGGGNISGGGSNSVANGGTIAGGGSNVATGTKAAVAGGNANQATTQYSAVGGGTTNLATGDYATIAGGSTNAASAAQAAVGGGDHNIASGQNATVAGGGANTASGAYSAVAGGYGNVPGGDYGTAVGKQASSTKRGSFMHGAGMFAAAGDAQAQALMLRVQTASATPALLALLGYINYYLTVPTNTTWVVEAFVVARRVDAGGEASAAYKWEGVIKRDTNTTAFVGTPTLTVLGEDDASWDCVFSANDTNDRLDITVTGAAGQTINWVARVQTVEVAG